MSRQSYYYELINRCIDEMNNEHHAVFEHSYKTDEQLKLRVGCEGVIGASCFHEDMDIVETISDILYDAVEIIPWLKNASANEDLRLVIKHPNCGKKYLKSRNHDWSKGAIPCNSIVVFLGKKMDMAGCVTGMYIKTAFPA